ncbi:MAG: hypothetical protein WBW04_06675 [Nitrolancea sp.]
MASSSRTADNATHLPKTLSRHGSNQRDWIISRIRLVRRLTVVLSFAGGAIFTGLALRHSTLPSSAAPLPASDTTVTSSTQPVQSDNAPSQSLFDSQSSRSFSVAPAAPAPQTSQPTTTRSRHRSGTS